MGGGIKAYYRPVCLKCKSRNNVEHRGGDDYYCKKCKVKVKLTPQDEKLLFHF